MKEGLGNDNLYGGGGVMILIWWVFNDASWIIKVVEQAVTFLVLGMRLNEFVFPIGLSIDLEDDLVCSVAGRDGDRLLLGDDDDDEATDRAAGASGHFLSAKTNRTSVTGARDKGGRWGGRVVSLGRDIQLLACGDADLERKWERGAHLT